jgi:N,N'-diacetyllegionaminate synthase
MVADSGPALSVGERRVSADEPCFVIAEIGVNHNGDVDLAARLIDVAADAGADAVKFQTFRTTELVVESAAKAAYQTRQTGTGTQAKMLAELELDRHGLERLRDHCRTRNVEFISTAFDAMSLIDVLALEPKVLKWASGEIDNVPLLRQAAATRLPILLSTGMATLDDIEAALAILEEAQAGPVAVLQCVSQYPAPLDEQNLRTIASMRERFGRVTGFSDHTEGPWAAIAARAFGMAILEKHITLDRNMIGPDHAASMEAGEFASMVSALRAVERALGDGQKRPMPSELDTRAVARKSLVYARDLPAGHVLGLKDIAAKRPSGGLAPTRFDDFMGRTLSLAVAANQQVAEDHAG